MGCLVLPRTFLVCKGTNKSGGYGLPRWFGELFKPQKDVTLPPGTVFVPVASFRGGPPVKRFARVTLPTHIHSNDAFFSGFFCAQTLYFSSLHLSYDDYAF